MNLKLLYLHRHALLVGMLLVSVLTLMPINVRAQLPDPCPDLSKVLDDRSALLALENDVDRLKLCVKRAELLSELEQLFRERQEILAGSPQGAASNGYGGIPPLASVNLPALPDAPAVEENVLETKTTSQTRSGGFNTWKIVRLWGQSGDLRAQLRNDNDISVSVKQGDKLSDNSEVSEVSPMGVVLRQKDKELDLKWTEQDG